MKRFTRSPLKIMGLGVIVAGLLVGTTLILLVPNKCPLNYTQAQVDATGCANAANVYSAIVMMLAALVLIIGIVWACVVAVLNKKRPL